MNAPIVNCSWSLPFYLQRCLVLSPFLIYVLNIVFPTAYISPLVSTSTFLAQLLQNKGTDTLLPSFLARTVWCHFAPPDHLWLQAAFTPVLVSRCCSRTRDAHGITPQRLSACPPP